jgi:predicted DNA-binding transcriptional regulator AlpA
MTNTAQKEEVLSRKAAAEFMGICVTTLDRLDDLPRIKIRRRVLYRQSALIQWLAKHTTKDPA